MRGLRVKRVMVCLVVGVVATWLSAWGCTIYAQTSRGMTKRVAYEHLTPSWHTDVPEEWQDPEFEFRDRHVGFTSIIANQMGSLAPYVHTHWSGWPLRALEGHSLSSLSIILSDEKSSRDYGIVFVKSKHAAFGRFELPVRPMWPGFLINTLVYAGACWLLLAAPGCVRRWRRKRNGRCPNCGYELKDLDTCPECGV